MSYIFCFILCTLFAIFDLWCYEMVKFMFVVTEQAIDNTSIYENMQKESCNEVAYEKKQSVVTTPAASLKNYYGYQLVES